MQKKMFQTVRDLTMKLQSPGHLVISIAILSVSLLDSFFLLPSVLQSKFDRFGLKLFAKTCECCSPLSQDSITWVKPDPPNNSKEMPIDFAIAHNNVQLNNYVI